MPVKIFTKIFPGWTGGNYIDIQSSVVPPPAIYLFDEFPGATIGYSVRKLRDAYTGFALEVRRDSDNATANIGFVGEDLDAAALTTFLGGNKGYVTKWYNQAASPVANSDALSTTALQQPQIIIDSGIYYLEFDPNAPSFLITQAPPGFPPVVINPDGSYTTFAVAIPQLNNIVQVLFQQDQGAIRLGQFNRFNNNATSGSIGFTATGVPIVNTGPAYVTGTKYMHTAVRKTTSLQVYLNGASNAASVSANARFSTTNIGNITVGKRLTSEAFNGQCPELILYPADKSTDRGAIETNIRTYYGF
jgi:hypothetical protein